MISFLRQVAAFPVRMLAEAASLLSFIDATALWSACWKLSGEASDGRNVLLLTSRRQGVGAARELGRRMLARSQDCEIAATMAFLEYAFREDWESVAGWIRTARENGCSNSQMLLWMELTLGNFLAEYDEWEIAEQILSRNDLPSDFTVSALTTKSHIFMERRRWSEAEAIADRILSIEEQPAARIVKWAVYMAAGEQMQAEKQLSFARRKLSADDVDARLAFGWLALGRAKEAMEHLRRCNPDRFRMRQRKGCLGQLARSAEFSAYCAGRADK